MVWHVTSSQPMKRFFPFFLFVLLAACVLAEAPAGYYDAADGKSGAELKTALHRVIRPSYDLRFDGFSATYWGQQYFRRTDWHPDGGYWDMYSDSRLLEYDSQKLEREHCLPRSWWRLDGDYGRANGDLHNLNPADEAANGRKSDNPLGETDGEGFDNGVSKVGASTLDGYTGTVFEPADEYKGDFARTYMYMVTCYEDYAGRWTAEGLTMLANEPYPVFQPWALEMLLRWHHADPVSDKERQRNDSVFALQLNRNPFIDFPDLADYVWGDRTAEPLSVTNQATAPTLLTPVDGFRVDFGDVRSSYPGTRYIPVRGARLADDLTVEFLQNPSDAFSVVRPLSYAWVNNPGGDTLMVRYKPVANRADTAVLRIGGVPGQAPVLVRLYAQGVMTGDAEEIAPVTPTPDMDVQLFYTGPWDKASLPANMTTNASGGPYANGDFSFKNNGEYLIVAFDDAPGVLQLAVRPYNAWGTNDNHLYIYEGTDADHFADTPVADLDNAFMQNGSTYNNTPPIPLDEDTRAIKIVYAKVKQNVGINHLIITRWKTATRSPLIAGQPSLQVRCADGVLHVSGLEADGRVRVYTPAGDLVAEAACPAGDASLPFAPKGVFLVKSGDVVCKFVSR